ncbi:MarR family winged helix-turn-helix transcriptional regulator [Sphingomonas oryzagri]
MDDPAHGVAARPAVTLAHDLRRFAGKLKRRLREQADIGDLTPSQTSVLVRLEQDGPSTTSALARVEGMRPQSMGTIIAVLEGAGLVMGMPDPSDGRQTLIMLTDQCRTWITEGRAAREDWLARTIEARLSPDEQARLVTVIPLLQRLIET